MSVAPRAHVVMVVFVVAAKPKWGGYVVGAWLAGIVANLWTKPQYRDIALRDLGLALGALALARLAQDAPEDTAMPHLRSA